MGLEGYNPTKDNHQDAQMSAEMAAYQSQDWAGRRRAMGDITAD